MGDDIVLVRQFRDAVGEELLEIPAGVLDVEGESPQECAVRELTEETGYSARDVRALGSIYTSAGFTNERCHLFACSAEQGGEPQEEDVEVVTMPFEDAVRAVRDGAITDAKTVAALLLEADRRR